MGQRCPPQDEEGAKCFQKIIHCTIICAISDTNLNTLNSVTRVKLLHILSPFELWFKFMWRKIQTKLVSSCCASNDTKNTKMKGKEKKNSLKKEIEVRKERRT